jgi:hypothetical protein
VLDNFLENLPDMSTAALSERVDIGRRKILVQVSPVQHFDDYGPDYDVIHVWALTEDGMPLTLRDIRPRASREDAFEEWSFLCDQLVSAATLVYGLRPDPEATQPNPLLGCWGPRPDLAALGPDDGATAMVIGIAVDTRDALRPGRHELFTLAVRSAMVVAIRRWIERAEPGELSGAVWA